MTVNVFELNSNLNKATFAATKIVKDNIDKVQYTDLEELKNLIELEFNKREFF